MCASLTCSDLTECSARVLAKIPDARLRRERRLAPSAERRPTHSIRTPDGSEQQSYLYLTWAVARPAFLSLYLRMVASSAPYRHARTCDASV